MTFLSHQLAGPRIVQANRRAAVRVPAGDLRWLDHARFPQGPELALIDLSLRGAQFEVPHRLTPGERAEVELFADGRRTLSLARIVRSEIAEVRSDVVLYRGACVFASPLPWAARLPIAAKMPGQIRDHLAYAPCAGWSEVVVSFRHGGPPLRGYVHTLEALQALVNVFPAPSASAAGKHVVPLALVRSICVLRDVEDGLVSPATDERHFGTPVEVAFKNNQVLRGLVPSYDPDAIGFWVLAPRTAEWRRVLAITAAVAEIRVLYTDRDVAEPNR